MPVMKLFRNEYELAEFKAGDTIFSQGDQGDYMFVVVEGEVEIRLPNGPILETVGPEDIFGEMALVDKEMRSASAIAKTDCRLAPIDKVRFIFLIQNTPFFALEVMSSMAQRLRKETAHRLEQNSKE